MTKAADQTLVVGATGLLGSEIVRLLRDQERPVRAVVRAGTDPSKRSLLASLGAEIVEADLKSVASLVAACKGVSTVISTASATMSRQPGDSIDSVDRHGQLALVEAADRENVGKFVFVSFPPTDVAFSLQHAKRAVEDRLEKGKMPFTVLQPVNFTEVWLSPSAGFDLKGGRVRLFGNGDRPISWISFYDVARFAVAASKDGRMDRMKLRLGGPDALTTRQIVAMFEELGGAKVVTDFVPESALESQLANAKDPIEEAFAAIMLTAARGHVVDPRPLVELVPGQMRTVREFTKNVLNATN